MEQSIKMTEEEQYKMYINFRKEQLIKMLIKCDKRLDKIINTSHKYIIIGQSEQFTCDSCGLHPSTIYTTSQGRFCKKCKNTNKLYNNN